MRNQSEHDSMLTNFCKTRSGILNVPCHIIAQTMIILIKEIILGFGALLELEQKVVIFKDF